jgi:hypothetical protein
MANKKMIILRAMPPLVEEVVPPGVRRARAKA